MNQRNKSSKQSLSGTTYIAISLITFLLAAALAVFLVTNADSIVKNHLEEKIFFLILVAVASSASVLLFGVMHSTASFEGNAWNGVLRLGGPACLFVVIVVIGLKLLPETRPPAPAPGAVVSATVVQDSIARRK